MEQDVKFDLAKTLIEFNQDQQFIELRERYSTRSFLEIMSVERSENRHSSFLAWLLEAKDFAVNAKDHPIVHLLDIAIRRLGDQGEKINEEVKCDAITGQDGIKNIVLSRDIKAIDIEEVKTEKSVKDVAITEKVKSYKESIQDRIDIYIKCKLRTSVFPDGKEITIIIENKVGTTEGQEKNYNKWNNNSSQDWKEYCQKKQTERYYTACHSNNTIFLFLTSGVDKGENIVEAKDSHFISITYQDILNEIIEPLLANQNLSLRVRVLLDEYVLSLSLPGVYTEDGENNNDKKSIKSAIILAERKQDVDKIVQLLEKSNYLTLILSAAKCLSEENEIKRADYDGNTISSAIFFTPEQEEKDIKNIFNLLNAFGHTYKNLFIAILKTYINSKEYQNDKRKDEIMDVYKSLISNARDLSEFFVKRNDREQLQSKKGNPGKGAFAEFVIREYIKYYTSLNGNNGLDVPYNYFKINDNYPLFKITANSEPKDKTRFFEGTVTFNNENYLISNQWGITRSLDENKLESFDIIFKKIFKKPLFKLENGKEYSTNASDTKQKLTLQNPWDDILENYTITVKRIYK